MDYINNSGILFQFCEVNDGFYCAGALLGRMVKHSSAAIATSGIPKFLLFEQSKAWDIYLKNKIDGWENNIKKMKINIPSQKIDKALNFCRGGVGKFTYQDVSLIHGDFTEQNIIWDCDKKDWKIIDFGSALVGDPRFDLGKIIWLNSDFCDEFMWKRFIAGWCSTSSLQVERKSIIFYAAIHALAALDWVARRVGVSGDIPDGSLDFFMRASKVLEMI
ncbi:hypothetical protein AA106555_1787 [Neokomagataea thailandica NBRC 106555]|uniref:Protein kinase domain-containing protein n=2 Tax=Neokomagataea TaxID=1223423 RepID=A0A4Y6V8N4_9PROT|nr:MULTISPECIES: phosphotransferase [Neokomagataea]QDH25228.1 hypothetical protein D5366_08385 [Neokomagataea tanensis]GBR54704.1 hypothetical protein AA106555_1787 [Neokomagataea thailandica NBRC 106555]